MRDGSRSAIPLAEWIGFAAVVGIGGLLIAGSQVLPDPVFEPVGPAAFPLWAGILLIGLACLMIAEAWRKRNATENPGDEAGDSVFSGRERVDLVAIVIGLTILYVASMHWAGFSFSVATALFCFVSIVLLAGLSGKAVGVGAAIALSAGFGLHYAFTRFFFIDLPG